MKLHLRITHLDDIAVSVARVIKKEKDPRKIIKALNREIYVIRRFQARLEEGIDSKGQPKIDTLARYIDTKDGSCGVSAFLYLAVAQRLALLKDMAKRTSYPPHRTAQAISLHVQPNGRITRR